MDIAALNSLVLLRSPVLAAYFKVDDEPVLNRTRNLECHFRIVRRTQFNNVRFQLRIGLKDNMPAKQKCGDALIPWDLQAMVVDFYD